MSCSSAATHSPLSPRGRARDPDEIAVRGKRLCRVERELPPHPFRHATCAELRSCKTAAKSPLPLGEGIWQSRPNNKLRHNGESR